MDLIESRRVAVIVALIQLAAVFCVFALFCVVENHRGLLIPLFLFLVPAAWLFLVFQLQKKEKPLLLAVVFYSSFLYVAFLLLWLSKMFVYIMEHQ